MMKSGEIASQVRPLLCICPDDDLEIRHLCIDSRQLRLPAATLFFAIRTDRDDGHRYIPELAARGVRNFVVTDAGFDRKPFPDCNFWIVEDAVCALRQIAAGHRKQFGCLVIGITGSNGKTIVKEWLSSVLAVRFAVTKSPDSYNSQIGVPLSVWQLNARSQAAVFEAGISRPGEMDGLAQVIDPEIGILTNLGMAHAQFFKDSRQKLKEKLRLFKNARYLIYHDNNELINKTLQEPEYARLKKISWGSQKADYPVDARAAVQNGTAVDIRGEQYVIPFFDAASVENALHVIVASLFIGMLPEEVRRSLPHLTHIRKRLAVMEGLNHTVLVDDTYSLDINSLKVALDFLDTQTQLADKALIISDFEQVGNLDDKDYADLDSLLQKHKIGRLLAVGAHFAQHKPQLHCPAMSFYGDTAELLRHLPEIHFSYEAVLIKGARKYHFEEIVKQLQKRTHPTVLEVSLPALVHNLNFYRSRLRPGTKMVAMAKASCYGLGDAEPVSALVQQHVDYLAVAYTDEGVRLRRRHVMTPVIVLGAEAHSFEVMVDENLEPEIFNFYYLHQLEDVLKRRPGIRDFPVHIKLDTGMHRLGFDEADLRQLAEIVNGNPQLRAASVFSHLAAADDPGEKEFTLGQIRLFARMSDILCKAFPYPVPRHILNSAGITQYNDAQFDMVRLGLGLYGFSEIPEIQPCLHNVATLKTVVTQVKRVKKGETIGYGRAFKVVRDMQVAVIPVGYADGYPRELGNGRGTVILQGVKVPVVGKVCMDMCMLDVTGLTVHEGDEVIVYGEGNTAADMARASGKISYELLTAVSSRVPRVYVRD